jgi:hypothetical protein
MYYDIQIDDSKEFYEQEVMDDFNDYSEDEYDLAPAHWIIFE